MRQAITVLSVSVAFLMGCEAVSSAVGAARDTTVAEVLGLGPDLPCDVDRYEAKRMTGAYLRVVDGSLGGTTIAVTGRVRGGTAPLPRNLEVDDSKIRGISAGADGILGGRKRSSATPISALNVRGSLPLAYDLRYRADGVDYSGPLVVGIPPLQDDVPLLGQAVRAGSVRISYVSVMQDGTLQTTQAIGDFAMQIGYGSGRAVFTASNFQVQSGPQLPFARMRWTRLGLCGARLVSTGQGVLTMYDARGGRVPVFGANADPTAGTLLFEASQFAAGETTNAPTDVGGVFAVQGDVSSVTAVFLSRGSPT